MLLVGVTGGIGAGKTAVARLLEERGAVVVHADALARQAVAPGSPGLVRILERFGDAVRAPDGSLDREALARIVFADPERRRTLEAITHPEVARLFAEATAPYRDTDAVVVYDVPLLVENHLEAMFDVVIVVRASEEVRVRRLADERGMKESAARARMKAQATDEERATVATFVLDNNGSMEDLRRRVDDLWDRLRSISSAR